MAKKKVKVTEEKVEKIAKVVSQSDVDYIWQNATTKSLVELCKDTSLTENQVIEILSNSSKNVEDLNTNEEKQKKIRNFLVKQGAVAMTPSQATIDNFAQNNNHDPLNAIRKKYGNCIEQK
jgi:hypothetical protein